LENIDIFTDDGIFLNIVFYHGRLSLALRAYTESILDEALYRKGTKDPFVSSTLYNDGVLKMKENRLTELITIVIASPVEEVGRDHDFDWGIIEPTSSRSILQSMGRINRHREIKLVIVEYGTY